MKFKSVQCFIYIFVAELNIKNPFNVAGLLDVGTVVV